MIYPVRMIVDDQPAFDVPIDVILGELVPGGALKVLDPVAYITDRQRNWYRGVCLPNLVRWSGEAKWKWDMRLKANAGHDVLPAETVMVEMPDKTKVLVQRMTISTAGVRAMTRYIDGVLAYLDELFKEAGLEPHEYPVTPPDSELRS